MLHPTKSTKFS